MNKITTVFKYEIINTIFRKSFLSVFLIFPSISILLILLITIFEGGQTFGFFKNLFSTTEDVAEGYIDQANLIHHISEDMLSDFYRFSNEGEAQSALEKGYISTYYIIDPNYLENGKITAVRRDFNPLGGWTESYQFQRLINFNLLYPDLKLYDRFYNIVDLEAMILSETPASASEFQPSLEKQLDPDQTQTFFLPYIVGMLFYSVVMGSSSLMLGSLNKEKNNRTIEILLTSISPLQMLTGKILALGLIGLGQTIFWTSLGWIILRKPQNSFVLEQISRLPAHLIYWGILFFLLGYLIFAGLLSGIGALTSYLREISQVATIILIPLIIPIMLINTMVLRPNSTLSLILSFLPFTSPVAMMTRMTVTTVPIWQILLSLFILLITALLTLWGVSKLFRAQILLAGQDIKIISWLKKLIRQE